MPAPQKPVWHYSLSTLLIAMLLVNLTLAYVSFVGWWGLFLAVVPPLFIGGLFNALWSEGWRPNTPRASHNLRVLTFLLAGFLLWLPFLAAFCLKP